MELILDIPMLADHRDEGGGRPPQTGNVEAIATGDRRVLGRHPHRFHGYDRLETRPFRELRQGCQVCDGPHPAAYCAAMRVIKGIKEILVTTPGEMGLDVLMKVLLDCRIRLFVMALQRQEIIAALVEDLLSDGGLTAHRIDGHHTALDSEQGEQLWHSGDLIGLRIGFALAYDEPTTL